MDDEAILDLFSTDKNAAVRTLSSKYGPLCKTLAFRILHNEEDAEECVNDTWLRLSEKIPPLRPTHLQAYVCRVVKNLAFGRLAYQNAQKRGNGAAVPLSEVENLLQADASPGEESETRRLRGTINAFLRSQSELNRKLFIRRYWYGEPVNETADLFGMTQNQVSARLHRTKNRLKKYLKKEGFDV